MEDMKFCQSCGMPMNDSEELYGTEKNGSYSKDYCKYCYENGAFTSDCTMEEMIEICIPHMISSGMGENESRSMMKEFLPF